MKCSIVGCDKPRHARSWCGTHYARWWRLGLVELPQRVTQRCDVDGCGQPLYSRGVCTKHYYYLRRYGAPVIERPSARQRFEARYAVDPSGCWLWQGRPDAAGYGRITIARKEHYAHRLSYELHVGPILGDLTIDHLCRVRLCVNPAHLEPVTRAENGRRGATTRSTAA